MMTTYRTIGYDDIDMVVSMMREFYAIDGYPIDAEKSKELYRQFIADETLGKSWLILSGNSIVGYVILTFLFSFEYGGTIAFIDELYISREARGKGVGGKTVEFLQEEAANLSLKMLYLEVEPHNAKAQIMYLASGFETHRRKFMQYPIR